MTRLLRSFLLLILVSVAIPAEAQRADEQYAGSDGGYLVYSVGTVGGIGIDFTFDYNRVAKLDASSVNDWKGKIEPKIGDRGLYKMVKKPEFGGDEVGHVVVRRLPPGRYSVDRYSFGGTATWTSKPDRFALPFTIKAGEATYIGTFLRGVSLVTKLKSTLGASGYLIVADREQRDIPIAKSKLPPLITITREVTDIRPFNNPRLQLQKVGSRL